MNAVTAAVLHALLAINPGACNEQAGAIVERTGHLEEATVVVSSTASDFSGRIVVPSGARLVALWHTHPACPARDTDDYFSPDDVRVQRRLRIPSFIYVAKDRSVHVLTNNSPTFCLTDYPLCSRLARGERVL